MDYATVYIVIWFRNFRSVELVSGVVSTHDTHASTHLGTHDTRRAGGRQTDRHVHVTSQERAEPEYCNV